jgi:hypothetical protein
VRTIYRSGLCLLLSLLSLPLAAQQISLQDLRATQLAFENIQVASSRPGSPRLLQVATLPGDAFEDHLPFTPNRLEPLVAQGQEVMAGDAIARLTGPELGLWLLQTEVLRARFEDAQRRYQRNLSLYEQQALDASSWLDISEHFRRLQTEWRDASHKLALLRVEEVGEGEEESALLLAPTSGLLLIGDLQLSDDKTLLRIVPSRSLRLLAALPANDTGMASALATGPCTLPVAWVAQQVDGFTRRVWSEPLGDCLPARPGLRLSGHIRYDFTGYTVPRSALFRIDGAARIAVKRGEQLEVVAVEVHGESDADYYVTADSPLAGVEVLTRSTSAVQGLLLGLGSGE